MYVHVQNVGIRNILKELCYLICITLSWFFVYGLFCSYLGLGLMSGRLQTLGGKEGMFRTPGGKCVLMSLKNAF